MKKIFAVMVLAVLVCGCCGCGARRPVKVSKVDTAMGTVIQQNIYTADRDSETPEEIMTLLRELEESVLSRRLETAEVWQVNQAAENGGEVEVSKEFAKILKACLEIWESSEGAFDVAMGKVVELWDIDKWAAEENAEAFEIPEEEDVVSALESSGSAGMRLDGTKLLMQADMRLDLGAVGKGIALDEIALYLEGKENITGAIISAGGSILTYGEKPDGSMWQVGIANPADASSNIGVLSLQGQWFVSTSGDYQRYVEIEGVRYHHILNPQTGYPVCNGLSGVTVLAKSGFLSDALSTACFVLGEEKGMELAERYDAEVLFVDRNGNVKMSEGMKRCFRAAAGNQ